MSKIEKALSRARRDNSLALVPTGRRPAADVPNEPAAPRARDSDGSSLIQTQARGGGSESIGRMREISVRAPGELENQGIIHRELAGNETVQAFREIRTKIVQRTKGRNAIVMVTSVTRGGGNSFVATNLGAAFAFDAGKTALLVDCNLRNPRLQSLLQNESAPGLTDYLEDDRLDIADIIQPVGIERLRLIPAGTMHSSPAEYFTSPRIRRLLADIRQRFSDRFVILDAPSMTDSADARILLELCDYVLLVVSYGRASNADIEESIKAVDGEKFLGVVFNDDPRLPSIDWSDVPRASLRMARHLFGNLRRHLRLRGMGFFKRTRSAK